MKSVATIDMRHAFRFWKSNMIASIDACLQQRSPH
jgi:hypothetical protein